MREGFTPEGRGSGKRSERICLYLSGASAAVWLMHSEALGNAARTVLRLAGKLLSL